MTKSEFLIELERGLKGLPKADVEERLEFYGEMIDDRIEEGLTESDAVAEIGSVDEVIKQIVADIPLKKLIKEKVHNKSEEKGVKTFLIILGFPIWFPLIVSFGAVLFALYAVIWSIVISIWAVELSLFACAVVGAFSAIIWLLKGQGVVALSMLGIGIFALGLSIFLYHGCLSATKGLIKLTKRLLVSFKRIIKER